jgi:hypothetical protein
VILVSIEGGGGIPPDAEQTQMSEKSQRRYQAELSRRTINIALLRVVGRP